MPIRFARENFTPGRRRRPISLSMLKVPNVHEKNCEKKIKNHIDREVTHVNHVQNQYIQMLQISSHVPSKQHFSRCFENLQAAETG